MSNPEHPGKRRASARKRAKDGVAASTGPEVGSAAKRSPKRLATQANAVKSTTAEGRPLVASQGAPPEDPIVQAFTQYGLGLANVVARVAMEGISDGGVTGNGSIAYADDFTWLRVRERTYQFRKGQQAGVIRALFKAWRAAGSCDGAGLSEETLADAVNASSGTDFRVRKLFKGNPALNAILRSPRKGQWSLFLRDGVALPESRRGNPG